MDKIAGPKGVLGLEIILSGDQKKKSPSSELIPSNRIFDRCKCISIPNRANCKSNLEMVNASNFRLVSIQKLKSGLELSSYKYHSGVVKLVKKINCKGFRLILVRKYWIGKKSCLKQDFPGVKV